MTSTKTSQFTTFVAWTTGLWFFGLALVTRTEKHALHLWINEYRHPWADLFFKYWTHVGDGNFVAVAIPVLLALHYQRGKPWLVHHFWVGALSYAVSGLLAQFFKKVVFPDVYRPFKAIGPEALELVEGVKMHTMYSFPSGHTTTSFAFFGFVAYVYRGSRTAQLLCVLLAILGGFSRVYLSQHFIEDTLAGAFLGTASLLIITSILNRNND